MSSGHFAAYKNALKALSTRTGASLPSLILSFGILHEITAIVPLVGVFYGARTLGIGERVIKSITYDNLSHSTTTDVHWLREKSRNWVDEGDRWAGRVGRRYGIFGFEKQPLGTAALVADSAQISSHVSGDVANAIVAYGVTKALIPLRVGISLYLAPAFSRRLLEPLRKVIFATFQRKSRGP